MKRSHQSSLQLLDTLMEIYRADNDGIVIYRSPLNFVDLTESAIDRFADLARERDLSIELHAQERDKLWVDGLVGWYRHQNHPR